jgi:type IV pilus assembly protein PilC
MTTIDLGKYKSGREKSKPGKKGLSELLNREISLFGRELSDKKKEKFYSEFSILLGAGIDIKTSLEIIIEQYPKQKDKELFSAILGSVVHGNSFSDALKESGRFSLSGRLPDVLQQLTRYYSNKIRQKRQLTSSLSYPAIVIVTATGAIYFMMRFIVPMFADIFKRFKTDLPYLTRLVINVSGFISGYFFLVFAVFASLLVFLFLQRKKPWFRHYGSVILLRLPVIGPLIRKVFLARFCQAMSLLLNARTPLVTALELTRNMISFYPLETSLGMIKDRIIRGESLYECLSEFAIYDRRMLSLVKVAEEVNKLDLIFEKLQQQYDDEVQGIMNVLGSLLEPVLIIFLGALVAVILISMYLPLFKLSTSVGF